MLRRKDREQAGQFLAEGPQAVREAIRYGRSTLVLVDQTQLVKHQELTQAAAAEAVEVVTLDSRELASLTDTVSPQGIVAICEFLDRSLVETVTARSRLLVCCADIRDPGNAGTVFRSADAFGADGVLFSKGSVDPYNPKTVRSSAGSLFHLPVVVGADLEACTTAARRHGLQVLAADGHGEADLTDLQTDGTLGRPTLWLFGNEAWGLPDEIAALADRAVRVPIWGQAESLNLASAASVCLFASASAQRVGMKSPGR